MRFGLCVFFLLMLGCKVKNQSNNLQSNTKGKLTNEWFEKCFEENPENKGEQPKGLKGCAAETYWHLSEGSEIVPFDWLVNLNEFVSPTQEGEKFLDNLDKKWGLVKDPYPSQYYPKRLQYVGLTAAWSQRDFGSGVGVGEYSEKEDQTIKGLGRFKEESGKKKIVFSGVNCSFCHSGTIHLAGKTGNSNFTHGEQGIQTHYIEGTSAMINLRGYFKGIFGGLIKTMLDEKELTHFLRPFALTQNEKELSDFAKSFSFSFAKQMEIEDSFKKDVFNWLVAKGILPHTLLEKKMAQHFYPKRKVVNAYLEALFATTFRYKKLNEVLSILETIPVWVSTDLKEDKFGINTNDKYSEHRQRMKYLSDSMTPDPEVATTPEGYARTDAFGRISNRVLRANSINAEDIRNSLIHYTAPVSLPHVWGIQYTAMLQFNANTGSVLLRNIGQSLGLGALILGESEVSGQEVKQLVTTINVDHLNKIEKLMYDIPVPNWTGLYGKESVNIENAAKGCDIFYNKKVAEKSENTCASCHEGGKEIKANGAIKNMIDYPLYTLEEIGTDGAQTKNQSIDIFERDKNGKKIVKEFSRAIIDATVRIKKDYMVLNHVSDDDQKRYGNIAVRGDYECFRDTFKGKVNCEYQKEPFSFLKETIGKPTGYPARHLSGIWATAPYLHNGSVPTIMSLLNLHLNNQPGQMILSARDEDDFLNRPDVFSVGSKYYDPVNLGYYSTSAFARLEEESVTTAFIDRYVFNYGSCTDREFCFDVSETGWGHNENGDGRKESNGYNGNSNKGHYFGINWRKEEKINLLEFLKVYNPEKQYAWSRGKYFKHQGSKCDFVWVE